MLRHLSANLNLQLPAPYHALSRHDPNVFFLCQPSGLPEGWPDPDYGDVGDHPPNLVKHLDGRRIRGDDHHLWLVAPEVVYSVDNDLAQLRVRLVPVWKVGFVRKVEKVLIWHLAL